MSIAFETNTIIERPGFVDRMPFKPIYDPSDPGRFSGDRTVNSPAIDRSDELDSCSSSSIGKNSDVSNGSSSDGEDESRGDSEVQSSFKGPLDCLDSLEEVLPIKRGISSFYSGKSKSYTSLADISSCSSVKDIAKKEDAYTRKRKNLLAHSNYWDKSRILENSSSGMSKRLANSSRSSLALSAMISSSESNENSEFLGTNSLSRSPHLPPLPPHGRRSKSPNAESSASPPTPVRKFSPWRKCGLTTDSDFKDKFPHVLMNEASAMICTAWMLDSSNKKRVC
ncbi:Damaged dna-binding 2 [Heracleum sosnowskyi]|uniref:Damaged dna-binding 2 n=1 Tax=Heracleum sosnowskyi TaxID=360622 RepID=A0AAD8I2M9_9APIA|nr:Damaged dna-binding 2 [Heracleum sosnowskyi]